MHLLILSIGLLLGIYGLYRFFLTANVAQIKALFLSAFFVVSCVGLLFLAVTGRLPAALGLLAALWPLGLAVWHQRRKAAGPTDNATPASSGPMTRAEALEVLGLKDGASDEDIKAAYKKLIKKIHPDQEGSQWLASRVNQAKDLLLKK